MLYLKFLLPTTRHLTHSFTLFSLASSTRAKRTGIRAPAAPPVPRCSYRCFVGTIVRAPALGRTFLFSTPLTFSHSLPISFRNNGMGSTPACCPPAPGRFLPPRCIYPPLAAEFYLPRAAYYRYAALSGLPTCSFNYWLQPLYPACRAIRQPCCVRSTLTARTHATTCQPTTNTHHLPSRLSPPFAYRLPPPTSLRIPACCCRYQRARHLLLPRCIPYRAVHIVTSLCCACQPRGMDAQQASWFTVRLGREPRAATASRWLNDARAF